MKYYLLAKLMVTFCRNRCCDQVQAMGDRKYCVMQLDHHSYIFIDKLAVSLIVSTDFTFFLLEENSPNRTLQSLPKG